MPVYSNVDQWLMFLTHKHKNTHVHTATVMNKCISGHASMPSSSTNGLAVRHKPLSAPLSHSFGFRCEILQCLFQTHHAFRTGLEHTRTQTFLPLFCRKTLDLSSRITPGRYHRSVKGILHLSAPHTRPAH